MRCGRTLMAVALASLALACAGPAKVGVPSGDPGLAREDLGAQREAVERALAGVEQQHTAALADFERRPESAASDAELERLMARRQAARAQVLAPLAARGNAEAMVRLAGDLRDSTAPADVARWLDLASSAASQGHPIAHDELVRWWWHQKGEGSIAAVQRCRARALDHAEAVAQAGDWSGVNRIAVYIAGDRHQYPANLPLAAELMRLCARGGDRTCQEMLALRSPYEFAPDLEERYFWLAVLGRRQRLSSDARLQATRVSLAAKTAVALDARAAAWRPATWPQLYPDWRRLRAAVLAHGKTSTGIYEACTTSKPWCRGEAVGLK